MSISIISAAQIIVNLLNDSDQLTLMAITNNIHTMDGSNKFHTMNSNGKNQLRKFIESLEKDSGATNHSLAFEYAFDWVKLQFDSGTLPVDDKSTPLQIIYVSRGIIIKPSETKTVLEVIAAGQSRLNQPIVINTCAIILGELKSQMLGYTLKINQQLNRSISTEIKLMIPDYFSDEKRSVYGREFLNDIATQNYSKYDIDVDASTTKSWLNRLNNYNQNGRMFVVNHRNGNDMLAMATVVVTDIWFKPQFLQSQIIVHQPIYDPNVRGKVLFNCCKFKICLISINFLKFFFFNPFRPSNLHNKNVSGLWSCRHFDVSLRFSRRLNLSFQSVFKW